MESVDSFNAALAGSDPLTGIRLLDALERDGRDLVAFADQVVARLREQLIGSLSGGQKNSAGTAALARAARRLATLDSNKGAAGGYRLQLELALLEGAGPTPATEPDLAQPKLQQVAAAKPQPEMIEMAIEEEPAPVAVANPQQEMVGIAIETSPPVAESRPPVGSAPEAQSAQAAQSAPAVQAAASAPPDAPLQALLDAWSQVVDRIGQNPANKPLIAACRPVEVHDATIVLGFPESKAFLRDAAERKRSVFEAEIGHVLGRAVAVRCVTTNIEIAPADATASDDLVAQAKRIFEGELLDVAEVD
jgi:hypothetical protein